MRDAIYRLTAPILDRIPDISHQPKGRQVSIGLAASLVFHLLLLFLAVLFGMVLPENGILHFAKSKPQLQEIEITVLPPEPAAAEVRIVALDEALPFLDSKGLAAAEKAPENPTFQSGKNMEAASELPARGDTPLPSQDGRVSPHGPDFTKQQSTLGNNAMPAPILPPVAPKEAAAPAAAETPAEPVQHAPPAASKPTPLKAVDAPAPDEIALTQKSASPAEAAKIPAPPTAPKLRMRTTAPVAMLTTPPRSRSIPAESASQLEHTPTQIDGSITNRGRKAASAKGTALGRYQEGVGAAVGSRWNYYVKAMGDTIALGSVRVRFSIDQAGRVSNVRTEDNTSNGAFATLCERSVLETKLAELPSELSKQMRDGKLEMSFMFTLY